MMIVVSVLWTGQKENHKTTTAVYQYRSHNRAFERVGGAVHANISVKIHAFLSRNIPVVDEMRLMQQHGGTQWNLCGASVCTFRATAYAQLDVRPGTHAAVFAL